MPVLSHSFSLPMPPDRALPLFTPRGEEAWVPGWAPVYVDPPGGETAEGMIFSTGNGAVWWTCLRWRPATGEARYLRLTPGVKAARVGVSCRAEGAGTRVTVCYDWHALGADGAAEIAALTPAGFASEIDGWRSLILAAATSGA
ncbi:MAG: SRPBCC family protein [Rhodobacter sp.]|nr:SRPBCC family protein [Rhodobacter sp.]